MDRQEAKMVLQALRPNDVLPDEAVFAEALALAETDPELKTWWEAQQTFDRKVIGKLAQIPIPEDLRATILAGRRVEKITPMPSFSFWLAAAAMVAILCVSGAMLHERQFGPQYMGDYRVQVLPLLKDDAPSLAMLSPDREKLMAWLRAQRAPMGTIPDKLAEMPTLGCQKYEVHGQVVSLICFQMPNGAAAHLFAVRRSALVDPPGNNTPEFYDMNGWNTVAWSNGSMSYVLASRASDDELKKLL